MADKNLDEYKQLNFYKTHTKPRQNGFAKFKEDGSHYFALYKDGDIAMLSQAYVNEAGRDNGIESVKKNSKLKKRYNFDMRSGGKHGFSLKAGNGQEIAISPNYGSKAEAERIAGRLNGSVRATSKTTTPKTAKPKTAPKKAAPKKAIVKKTAPKKVVAAKAPRKVNDEDNYRHLAFYNKHTKGRKSGIESFKGDDGLYYFAHFENGKIRLISEGYPTVKARDTGVASVQKNIKLPKRYDYRGPLKNGKYDYRLKAGNGKEIARSVWYGSAAAAATGAAYLMGTRKRTAPKSGVSKPKVKATPKVKAAPKVKSAPRAKAAPIVAAAAVAAAVPAMAKAAKPVTPRDKDDDYLPCAEYHGHKVTDEKNNVAFFSHSNNQEYFVIYDDNGEVLIRSEGFNSISKRSSELAAVLRLKDNSDYYTRVEKNGYFMTVLKDETGREVGRSCLKKVAAPVAAAAIPAAAAAIPAAAAAIPAATAVVPAAATGGMGWGWLKWLLPLLLLLLLGLFGLKACSASKAKVAAAAAQAEKLAADKAVAAKKLAVKKAAEAKALAARKAAAAKAAAAKAAKEAAAVVTPPPAPKPVATPKPVAAPKVTANMNRLCSASDNVLFNVPSYATPVSVGRLGTFPEFGDSHGLTPTQFYNKLASRFASSDFDRKYLNYVAKSLGYAGGFSDMSAADFSNETLAQGTKGLLGYGEFHGLTYSQLNVSSSRDLEAFRIRAANGTDVHFMKTCGNYMYVCN